MMPALLTPKETQREKRRKNRRFPKRLSLFLKSRWERFETTASELITATSLHPEKRRSEARILKNSSAPLGEPARRSKERDQPKA